MRKNWKTHQKGTNLKRLIDNERSSADSLFRKGNVQLYPFTLNSTHDVWPGDISGSVIREVELEVQPEVVPDMQPEVVPEM